MTTDDLRHIVLTHLSRFYERRLKRLQDLKLRDILAEKNPYLFRAIGVESGTHVVEQLLDAYLSSSDEGIFGTEFFEPVAKAVCGGVVATAEGVDIAIETEDRYLAIAVKSGPNPFNSSQAKRQNDEFLALNSRLSKLRKQFDALLGHCYGRRSAESTKSRIYRIRSGQAFWAEITGDETFYLKLIHAIETDYACNHRLGYQRERARAVNRYVREFTTDFCDANGAIDWQHLVEFNSGRETTRRARVSKRSTESSSSR